MFNSNIAENDGKVGTRLNYELTVFSYWNEISHNLDYIIKTAPSRSGGDIFTSLLGGAAPGMHVMFGGFLHPHFHKIRGEIREGPAGN